MSPPSGTYTNLSATFVSRISTSSDVYYQIVTQLISVVDSSTVSITPDLSCSSSCSTSIAYSTSNYCLSVVPSWVSIDSGTGVLTISEPSVDADTEFDFYVSSSVSGLSSSLAKLIKLTIAYCQVQNWQKCSSSNYSTWTTWNFNYVLNSGAWAKNIALRETQKLTKKSNNYDWIIDVSCNCFEFV